MSRPACARIDLAALNNNFQRVKAHAPQSRIMAVVKANAYGHGLDAVADALYEADGFAVASVDEAITLREYGIDQEICVLTGFCKPDELVHIDQHQLTPVIHCQEQIEMLAGVRFSQRVDCWVKLDSGMHRAGFLPEQFPGVYKQLLDLSLFADVRFMSHLANAQDCSDTRTHLQLNLFKECCGKYPSALSLANSAGIVGWLDTHLDWVRPGIMLYGCSPVQNKDETALGLRPVMTLQSELIAVKELNRGDAIGYGGTWCCPEDMRVGLVACGYADGYPRHAPSGTPVYLKGQRTQLVGPVSMDLITIDLRPCPQAGVGDVVELWGANVTATEVASYAGTIAYELLSKVTSRVTRING